MNKKTKIRWRRAKPTRMKIRELQVKDAGLLRLSIHRTPKHISVQAIRHDCISKTSSVLAHASTMEAEVKTLCVKSGNAYTGNVNAAKVVGKVIAERLNKLNLPNLKLAFDRSGFKYHGRVQALADSAREHGLDF
jgi:large subunit ribosomal protein L18